MSSNQLCSVDNCTNGAQSRGWCGKHYQRWRTYGDPNAAVRVRNDRPVKAECVIDGCKNPVTARGWCGRHYRRWRQSGDPEGSGPRPALPGERTCSISGCPRPMQARGWCKMHWTRWRRTGDPGKRLGERPGAEEDRQCLTCNETKSPENFALDTRYPSKRVSKCFQCQKKYQRAYGLARRYGLSMEEYSALESAGGGRCATCDSPGPLCVDHDHSTGRVRGLLCQNCNKALGHAKDNPDILKRLIEYLGTPLDG